MDNSPARNQYGTKSEYPEKMKNFMPSESERKFGGDRSTSRINLGANGDSDYDRSAYTYLPGGTRQIGDRSGISPSNQL